MKSRLITDDWQISQDFDGHEVLFLDSRIEYRYNGQLHREYGPAVIYNVRQHDGLGNKYWYLNGLRHREDGPAVEYIDGTKEWYLNGKLHREDGPAREYANGEKHWYLNGFLHREGGPAIIWKSGDEEWYLKGIKISPSHRSN